MLIRVVAWLVLLLAVEAAGRVACTPAPVSTGRFLSPDPLGHAASPSLYDFGLLPGVGEPLDILNGLVLLGRGNYGEAAPSLGAAVPVPGWGATGVKIANRADNAADVVVAANRTPVALPEPPPLPSPPAQVVNATESAAGTAGDHIALGIKAFGLEERAAQVGARTLLSDPTWRTTLQSAVQTPSTRFTVFLDGFEGTSTYTQIMGAAQRGATPLGRLTEWEMTQLFQAGRLETTTFMRGGSVVPNPFGPP